MPVPGFIYQAGVQASAIVLPKWLLHLPESKGYKGYTIHSAEMMRVGDEIVEKDWWN